MTKLNRPDQKRKKSAAKANKKAKKNASAVIDAAIDEQECSTAADQAMSMEDSPDGVSVCLMMGKKKKLWMMNLKVISSVSSRGDDDYLTDTVFEKTSADNASNRKLCLISLLPKRRRRHRTIESERRKE